MNRKKKVHTRVCKHCGKEFQYVWRETSPCYCEECLKPKVLTCVICGKKVKLNKQQQYRFLRGELEYFCCSIKCAQSDPKANAKRKAITQSKKQTKVCVRCGKEYKCNILASNRLYCDECLNEEIHLKCAYCGKDFILSRWKNKEYFKEPEKFEGKTHCSNECAQLDPKIKEKKAKTCEEKYGKGIINPFQAEECKEKAKETCRKIFGTDYAMQSEEGKKLSITGIRAKYGDEYNNIFQVPEIMKKIQQVRPSNPLAISTKIILSNNKQICTRSFWETIFLLYLYYNNINFQYETIRIKYKFENKICYYRPDFYLPEFNYLVEIKGWDMRPKRLKYQIKAAEKQYNYEIIYDITFFKQWLLSNTDANLDKIHKKSKEAMLNGTIYHINL